MPTRRHIFGGIGAGLEALGQGITRRALMEKEDKERDQQLLLSLLPTQLQAVQGIQAGTMSPEQFTNQQTVMNDMLKAAGRNVSMPPVDVNAYLPTPAQATKPVREQVMSARTPEEVPSIEEIIASVSELPTGPRLLEPAYGQMPDTSALEPQEEGVLESTSYGPIQSKGISDLDKLAQSRYTDLMADEESQFARGETRQLDTAEKQFRQGQRLEDEFAPAENERRVAAELAIASDPRLIQLHKDQFRSDQEIAARIQAQYRQPQLPQSEFMITGAQGLNVFDPTTGQVIYTVPPNTEGIVFFDPRGNAISFRAGKRQGVQQATDPLDALIMDRINQMRQRGGVDPANPPRGNEDIDPAALMQELERLQRELQENR